MKTLLQENHIKYGLIMTGLTALWVLLMHVTGVYTRPESSNPADLLFIFISPFVVWYLGIRAKKEMKKGQFTFKEGFIEGFKISLAYGLTSPFVFALYYLTLNPSILTYVREAYDMLTAPVGMVVATDMLAQLFSSIIGGSLYGAIIAFFLKSKLEKKQS